MHGACGSGFFATFSGSGWIVSGSFQRNAGLVLKTYMIHQPHVQIGQPQLRKHCDKSSAQNSDLLGVVHLVPYAATAA